MKGEQTYLNQLRKHGLKVTPRRAAVIELLSREKKYFSPLQVWSVLRTRFTSLGLPTAYRILEELRRIGLLTRIEREDRQLYYFFCETPHTTHHHHFVCNDCGKVQSITLCDFARISEFIETELNGKAENHSLQVEGLCSQCREKNS